MKKQSGITLIALVVTIIVLLLLAGVTISLVVGDNGILTQATKAVIENKSATAREEVAMAWTSVEADYWNAWSKNTKLTKANFITKAKINAYLESKGEIPQNYDFKFNENVNTLEYVRYENPEITYTVTITEKGKVEVAEKDKQANVETFAKKITAANYGDKVNYVASNGYSDWKIFYSNGSNVFLIASDSVDKTLVPSVMYKHSNTDYPYSVYWNSIPTTMSETDRQDTLFGITGNSYKLDENNTNSKCVSTLLDTANWSTFKDVKGYGEYAIGGATIEMLMSSWNAKGELYNTEEETKYQSLKTENGTYGYYLGKEPTSYVYNITSNVGCADLLYFPHQEAYNNCNGYWLAAPTSYTKGSVMYVYYSGGIGSWKYNDTIYGVRPVVSLSSKVIGAQDENGVWQLTK